MRKKQSKLFVLAGLLFLGIGFASVSTTLYINGTVNTTTDVENFENNVVFNSVSVDATSSQNGTTAKITNNGKTIEFTTHALSEIGETVTITYNIKNDSIFNAYLGSLSCSSDDDDNYTYLEVNPANNIEWTTLKHNGGISDDDTIEIQMIRSYVGDTEKSFTYTCEIEAEAISSAD
jgi:hypothetical protein